MIPDLRKRRRDRKHRGFSPRYQTVGPGYSTASTYLINLTQCRPYYPYGRREAGWG